MCSKRGTKAKNYKFLFFYIKGHKDGNVMEKSIISNAISEWFSDLTEEKVEKMYKNKRNYQFEVILSIKPQLV